MNVVVALFLVPSIVDVSSMDLQKRVMVAINCGGGDMTGAYNIHYQQDQDEYGLASDYGRKWRFLNVAPEDVELYQTERYFQQSFAYNFRVKSGEYVLWLKFSEVYFHHPGKKVFNVLLNGVTVIDQLDIVALTFEPGYGLDRYIPFKITGNVIEVHNKKVPYEGNLVVAFEKLEGFDNPKINAILILSGGLENLPALPAAPLKGVENDDDTVEEFDTPPNHRNRAEKSIDEDDDQMLLQSPKEAQQQVYDEEEDDRDHIFYDPNAEEDSSLVIIISLFVFVIPMVYILRKME